MTLLADSFLDEDRFNHESKVENVQFICTSIQEMQVNRVAIIKAQIRINNATRAFVRRLLGWRFDMKEEERKKIANDAASIVKAVEEGEEVDSGHRKVATASTGFILASMQSRSAYDELRSSTEKAMVNAVKDLPVFEWAEAVRGFGSLGLAIIVGESGNLSNYSNPGKLWKRLGLAVFDGKSQRKCTNAEEAIRQGYNPRRRSAIWTLGDSLLKLSKNNPYRDLFDQRIKYEVQKAGPDHPTIQCRGMKTNKKNGKEYESYSIHARRRAQRYVEKRLVKDLWIAWRRAAKDLPDMPGY
jgi:hypothetical protein